MQDVNLGVPMISTDVATAMAASALPDSGATWFGHSKDSGATDR